MGCLVCGNFGFVLKRQADVVQSVEQAMADEFVHGEGGEESLVVAHFAFFEVDGYPVVVDLECSLHELCDFVVGETHCQEAVLGAVVGENVRK